MDRNVPVDQEQSDGDFSRLIAELRQWHVFRIAGAYVVGAWLLVQVIATIGPAFDLPNWVLRAVVLALIVGFLATMAFMLFRARSVGKGRHPIYLSQRARLVAGAGVLIVAAAAGTLSIRSLTAPEQVSLAVLPFADLSPARDKAYFAEGVAEEILSTLAAEKGIKVLGRTSARQIESNPDPKVIRASLGVTHLLEGSTRTAGNGLRVNVRLVDTSDGSQVWEEEYTGAISDVFAVQDNIATAVVRRVRGTFFGEAVRSTPVTAVDAYQAYLAARALIRERKKEPLTRAWHMAREVVKAHPNYAPGHALYAEVTSLLSDDPYSYGDIPTAKAKRITRAHASQAIRLAPDLAEGYAALGLGLPWHQALDPFQKALSLDPSRADVRLRLAIALNALGRNAEALDHYRAAAETEPLWPATINRYVAALTASGRTKEASEVVDQFVRRGGSEAQAWRFRANILSTLDLSRSVAARKRAMQLDPDIPYQGEWLAHMLSFLGLPEQASAYVPGLAPYRQMFLADNRGALSDQVAKDRAAAWGNNGIEFAIFSFARARDWSAIERFHDSRSAEYRDLCAVRPRFSPLLILALQNRGRVDEARRLLECSQRHLSSELRLAYRNPDDFAGELEMLQASLLALRNDRRALDWLDRAVQRGWLGQYYSANLADWPQFDVLRGDPRYAAIQKRIDATIARERAETLAGR